MELTAVILAAGEAKRMRSRQPKVLHPLCGRPLIPYARRPARAVAARTVVVIGPNAAAVRAAADAGVTFVEQRERLGTGHALEQARAECGDGPVVVLAGDMPLLSSETLERLVSHHRTTSAAATVLTAVVDRPQGYGRILRQGGRVKRIVEDRDATDDQKKITEINTSVYCFEARRLWKALAEVRPDNEQGEYYLTDVIGILAKAGGRIEAVVAGGPAEAPGIHDPKQLAAVAGILRRRLLDRPMTDGVTIVDPPSTYIEDTVTIGPHSVVYPPIVIEGVTTFGAECVVGSGSQISASRLGDHAFVGTNSSLVAPLTIGEGAYIGAGSTITKDVPPGALAVGRGHQVVKEGWAARKAKKHTGPED